VADQESWGETIQPTTDTITAKNLSTKKREHLSRKHYNTKAILLPRMQINILNEWILDIILGGVVMLGLVLWCLKGHHENLSI